MQQNPLQDYIYITESAYWTHIFAQIEFDCTVILVCLCDLDEYGVALYRLPAFVILYYVVCFQVAE